MFDIGWQEFILVALVAVVVVGPKDLPRVIRSVGQWIRKARSLASEFQGSLEEMARESELDDVRREIQQASRGGLGASIEKHIDPDGEIRKSVESAKAASGADEIKSTLNEAHQDARALTQSGAATTPSAEPVEDYASLAAKSKAPGNSVVPPSPSASAAVETPPKPARKTAAKTTAKKAAPKRSAATTAAKPAAKPRRTAKKPADSDSKKA